MPEYNYDTDLKPLVDRVKKSKQGFIANDSASLAEDLVTFENHYGYRLPEDLADFYRQVKSSHLLKDLKIVSVAEIEPASVSVYGKTSDMPDSWFAFCDCGNSDWIGIDLSEPSQTPILDLRHEELEFEVIALSFREFLAIVLSGGRFWYKKEWESYGNASIRWGSKSVRENSMAVSFWNILGDEIGPEQCKSDACSRLRIPLSVLCKKHHFESFHGVCPFEDDADLPTTATYIKSGKRESAPHEPTTGANI